MASEGPLSPGTVVDQSGIGTETWSNPGNAVSSNDADASWFTQVGAGTSHYLKATNFGFAIPSGATIDGIVVEVEGAELSTDADMLDAAVRIVKGGTIGATDKSNGTEWTTFDTYRTYGSSSDLWGESWTDADINDSTFGFAFATTGAAGFKQMLVDHIRITVYYTEGAAAGQPAVKRMGGVQFAHRLGRGVW